MNILNRVAIKFTVYVDPIFTRCQTVLLDYQIEQLESILLKSQSQDNTETGPLISVVSYLFLK